MGMRQPVDWGQHHGRVSDLSWSLLRRCSSLGVPLGLTLVACGGKEGEGFRGFVDRGHDPDRHSIEPSSVAASPGDSVGSP